jgi:serine/threonine protein kinase
MTTDTGAGATIAGYRVERLLGRGGMGAVYLAEDLLLGRKVALKLLAPELAADERFRERFLRESRLAASLDHPAIVPIYQAGEADGQRFIAMRYVEGSDLRALLAQGPLEPGRTLRSSRTSRRRWTRRTGAAWCTGTSSPATYCSTRKAMPICRTSA